MLPSHETNDDRGSRGGESGGPSKVDRVADEIRAFLDSRPAPDLTALVVRTITSEQLRPTTGTTGLGQLVSLFWMPRTVNVRPVYGMLLSAAVLFVALAPSPPVTPIPPAPPSTALAPMRPAPFQHLPTRSIDYAPQPSPAVASPRVFVQFRLPLHEASDVKLAGSFTGWQRAHAMRQTSPGVWTVTVPLQPGVHDYLFVVDGRNWIPDPHAPRVSDGFGGVNSRLALVLPEDGAS